MGDSSPSAAAISSNGTPTSTFRRTVTLYDWWLVKSQNDFHGYRLAISGISSRKEEAVRFFVSAPIIKRYDVFSLETADGIYVITRGFINEQRTLENGFTPQILKSFIYGFPPNWESYALECIREGTEANIDSANAVPDNVSAICQEILSDGEENFIPTSLVLPDEALEKYKEPFATGECKASKEMSGVDVAYGSRGNRHSIRLRNIKVCQQKQRHASGGPCEHPDKEQSSTSTEVETRDSDTAFSDNVSPNLPEMSSDAAEKSFPTLVSTDKTTGDCNKAFLEDERDMPIKTGEVNVVNGSGRNRRSARMRNIKLCQKKQHATGGPATRQDKYQISTSAALEKSDGGLESLWTPVQSQKGIVNTLSGNVTNKFRSRISKPFSAKTEGCYKKKRERIETEVAKPKRKITKPASSVNSPQGRDVNHSNKGSQQRLSTVSPESLSLKKSRSGRWLLPPLEFWRNQQPIYNMDREITEIQEGSSLISPFRGSSPSSGSPTKLTKGCYKKKRATVETEVAKPKRKITKPASSVKSPQGRDVSHSNKGSQQRLSTISPESLNLKKSRSGRWLLPPLEFWRNQQPIYNMDREITEIQEGSSLISPFRGSSPSSGRSAKNMRGGKRISAVCVSNTSELKKFLQHKENDL